MLAIEKPRALAVARGGVVALLVGMLAGCTPPGPRALLEGERLIREGHFSKAIEQLKTATELLPKNAGAWNHLGIAYHHAGQVTNAMIAYHRALTLDRDLMTAHYNLGCLWLEQDHPALAVESLQSFVMHPRHAKDPNGWTKLGAAYLRARRWDDAEKVLNHALQELGVHTPELWNNLGIAQTQRRRITDAAAAFNAALELQPDHAPALLNLARLYHRQPNTWPLALQKYRDYLALSPAPEHSQAVASIADRLEAELNPPRSPSPAGPARTRTAAAPPPPRESPPAKPPSRPASTPAESRRGAASSTAPAASPAATPARSRPAPPPRVDSSKTSPPERTAASDSAPPKPRAAPAQSASPPRKPERGAVVAKGDDLAVRPAPGPARAAPAVRSVTSLPEKRYRYTAPRKPASGDRATAKRHFTEGLQRQRAGQHAEALECYGRAVARDPAYFEAHHNLALAAYQLRQWTRALAACELALALEPRSVDARHLLAASLRQAGYFHDAARELQTILQSHPDETRAHLTLGNLYAQQLQQPQRARPHYLKVLERAPQHPQAREIRFWLAAHP
ncbi:MAG: tetratricopeptide repeat protein [Verrucomicrobia bacterium]|nr:tetratricopeptide repeat protein [Verrucomicrobiota bacterium]